MIDPFVMALDDLLAAAAQKAAAAGDDQLEEARQLGCFLGLSMAKSLYVSMGPHVVDNNSLS